MTHAAIYKNAKNGELVGFRTKGHAGFAYAGFDIVCAAVSALSINTINSIEQFTDSDCEITENERKAVLGLEVRSTRNPVELQLLLKSLELGLTQIAKDNPDYLSITFKEV
jgi:hypothetical protein